MTSVSGSRVADAESLDFAAFYRERWDAAVRLAFVVIGNAEAAEDVTQEALTRVESRFATLRDPWPYTRVVIVNLCRTEFRRRRREEARLRLLGASQAEAVEMAPDELLDAIDRLPFRQKAVIVLRYYEDLTEESIAEALGCRPGTVKSLAARALDRLAKEVRR
jgi:RNA polymerase sigma factor (sigma-70 family)